MLNNWYRVMFTNIYLNIFNTTGHHKLISIPTRRVNTTYSLFDNIYTNIDANTEKKLLWNKYSRMYTDETPYRKHIFLIYLIMFFR